MTGKLLGVVFAATTAGAGALLRLIACIALFAATQANADTVYDLIDLSSITVVSGTITTDCNSCTLTQSDITAWNIDINAGPHFATNLSNSNSTVSLTGSALTATPTALSFDLAPVVLYSNLPPIILVQTEASICNFVMPTRHASIKTTRKIFPQSNSF